MDSSEDDNGGPSRKRGGKAASQRMAQDSDDDERGGLGLIGARRRRGNGEEGDLGVFADGGSSGDEFGKGKKKKGKGKKGKGKTKVDHSQPVGFIRGKTLNKTAVPTKKKEDGDGSGDDEIDSRFKFTGLGANGQDMPLKQEGPQLQARNEMSFAQMNNTYGKGYNMLKKMGFSGGGLGKREDGIANPINVVKRQDKAGIQDEGEKYDQDLYGTEHTGTKKRSIDELLNPVVNKEPDQPKASEGWKKDKPKKAKVTYKTAAELAAEATLGDKPSIRIVDMRGPEVKVASSFSELASSFSGESVKSLKELRHNTRLLVAKYEDKVRSFAEKKKFYQDMLVSVERDKGQLDAVSSIGERGMESCREMVTEIEKLRERQDSGSVTLLDLGSTFSRLQGEKPLEFKALKVFDAAVALAVPLAKRELSTWEPLQKPEDGVKPLKPWRKLAQGADAGAIHMLLDGALLPRLRHAMGAWSPRDSEPCIKLLECCRKGLPPEAGHALVNEIIMPRLMGEVEVWDPRTDSLPIHIWIHPWLPVLGDQLNMLWSPIRFKFSSSLERWNPSDHSVIAVLKPWRQVFQPADWEPLVEKVYSRLGRAIADAGVKPDGQDVGPIKDLLAWLDVLPITGLAQVLEAAFFPQWHEALRKWLRQPECDFTEILQWYQGWRGMFPEALRDYGSVQKQLAHGLQVMKQSMSNGGEDDEEDDDVELSPEQEPQPSPSTEKPTVDTKPAGGVSAEEVSLSMSEYLGEVAGEHGLVFRPKGRTNSLGRQVYQLGAITICLDKNMVLVKSQSGADEDWKIASFDEVLVLAKREKKGAGGASKS